MSAIEFPSVIDNTMRKLLVKCPKAAHYRFEQGLQSVEETRVDLVAGKAFAEGLKVARTVYFVNKQKHKMAVDEGIKACLAMYGDFHPDKASNKTRERVAAALAYYFQERPMDEDNLQPLVLRDGTQCIEFAFKEELPILHPDGDRPLYYVGRFDLLARHKETQEIWVVDEKSTSQMGEKWANQWLMDSQMTGYVWGAQMLLRKLGIVDMPVAGAIINGIAIRKYDYEVGRFTAMRADWEIERWYNQMVKDVQNWKRAFLAQDHNMNLDHACAYYNNPCEYVPLCKSKNPERLIDGSYVIHRWNPEQPD